MKKLLTILAAAVFATGAFAATINLATVTQNYLVVESGDVLTGTLGVDCKIMIKAGAEVTLSGATINVTNSDSCQWAGITCLGDARIRLAGENVVKGFYKDFPGIGIHSGYTLTIDGNGFLNASSNGNAAGIGGGYSGSCGNIVIESGTVVATGAGSGAGIGGGMSASCGDITINGGTVYATGGSDGAAAIGCGKYAIGCGDIVIGQGVESLSATRKSTGFDDVDIIGLGYSPYSEGTFGTVTVGPREGRISTSNNGANNYLFHDTIALGDLEDAYTLKDGDIATGTLAVNVPIKIEAGAVVTLRGATISKGTTSLNDEKSWAGLECLGDAWIILEGANTVKPSSNKYPAIYIPADSTLTIDGTGSLVATGYNYCAGIGGGNDDINCGKIVINSGTITATGGIYAAGIGSGYSATCGAITINGGDITATGGYYAAGIGSGYVGLLYYPGVKINEGITKVVATSGIAGSPIGAGYQAIGTVSVTVSSVLDDSTDETTRTRTVKARVVDLSEVTEDTTILTATTVTGTLGGNYKITIADGASVTLSGMTINGDNSTASYKWAGITCLGDATITLDGANTVCGFYEDYPGIYVPEGSTLTIRGDGSLNAYSNGYGAGIGGGYNIACGSIVIENGTINATGSYGAGIGGGYKAVCGSIAITGGTVTAEGEHNAPGIGSGYQEGAICGDISITGGSVTATGNSGASGIGSGQAASCGGIVIGAGVELVEATSGSNCQVAIGAGVDGTAGEVSVDSSLFDEISGRTRYIRQWEVVDLAAINAKSSKTMYSGTVMTGPLYYIYDSLTIDENAVITLRDVTIEGEDNEDYDWAGITCEGNATIILEGENIVKGFYKYYPGIYVPEGATLVIKGSGSLVASSNGRGAGIGGGYGIDCGNIVVEGGAITATGGLYAAGIGGGGTGDTPTRCGAVSIGAGVTRVVAKAGYDCTNPIGAGTEGKCLAVVVDASLSDTTDGSTRTITAKNVDASALSGDMTFVDGSVITGAYSGDGRLKIAAGATVTLKDASIDGTYGLECLGGATIILEGANTVNSHTNICAAISVPSGSMLTIKGTGSLTADASDSGGAGIGGGYQVNSGRIVISGGTLNATGCYGAGIGRGSSASGDDIFIYDGVYSVTAYSRYESFGVGPNCWTQQDPVLKSRTDNPFTYYGKAVDISALTEDYTASDGAVLNGTTTQKVTIPAGAIVTVNGVKVVGGAGGTVLPAPVFAADGMAVTTEFVRGTNGTWTITAFAELGNDALGKDVADGQIKVYAADTLEGLKTASPMAGGVVVEEKKSAIKAKLTVLPPDPTAPAQFFKVKFGE